MSTSADFFRELHRLHLRVRDLREEARRGPERLRKFQAKIDLQQKQLQDAQEAIKHLKVVIHEKEVTLKENADRVARYQQQMNTATSRKEYDALQHEINHTRQASRVLEDEILATMETLEEKTRQLPELQNALAQAQAEHRKAQEQIAGRQSDLEQQLAEATAALAAAEANVPADIRPQYTRLVSAFGADALAPVTNRSCAGCYNELTAQGYNDLRAGRIVFCKSCGRILYLPE
jgi:predicted  nucleic acid-binding Zn-ribbon protein